MRPLKPTKAQLDGIGIVLILLLLVTGMLIASLNRAVFMPDSFRFSDGVLTAVLLLAATGLVSVIRKELF